jgi:hypothetical protein
MGEHAKYHGEEIKIGTCEDMYYLRFDQRNKVTPLRGNVDPGSESDVHALRFRFPWPDEDKNEPGAFESYGRAIAAHDIMAPAGVDHSTVQFVAHAGYLVSLPCPEGQPGCTPGFTTRVNGLHVARNGFSGAVQLVQQKLLADGRLVPVCRCGGCGTARRKPSRTPALNVSCVLTPKPCSSSARGTPKTSSSLSQFSSLGE